MISTAFIPLTQQTAKNDRNYFLIDNKFYDADIEIYANYLVVMKKMCILNYEIIEFRIIYLRGFLCVIRSFLC